MQNGNERSVLQEFLSDRAHLLRRPEVDHLVKVVDAEEEHGGLLELAHGVDAVLQPLLDHLGQLSKQVALRLKC